jgi:creatinine amidohydrolase
MRTRRLELLRPGEILAEIGRCAVVYLPLAPLEWHGPHLPFGVDPLYAHDLALRLADRLGGIVHPCLYLGTERERDATTLKSLGFSGSEWIVGMDFPANSLPSLYLPEEVLAIVVRHQIYLLQKMGFRHVVLVNGHGGRNHVAALKRLAGEISIEGRGRVHYVFTFPEGAGTWSRRHHASTDETAVMRYLYPETVDTEALPPPGTPGQEPTRGHHHRGPSCRHARSRRAARHRRSRCPHSDSAKDAGRRVLAPPRSGSVFPA